MQHANQRPGMSKILSIIIPMYNAELYIARCIDSILNQGLDPNAFEIVVMNDGSKDSSPSIVQKYIDNGKPVLLHSHDNVGCDGTRNRGFKYATGRYIYIMDADDYLAYNSLNFLMQRAIEDDLDIIAFDALFTGEDALFEPKEELKTMEKPAITTGKEYLKNHRTTRFETWWFIVKRELLEETGVRFEEGNACSDTYYMLEHFLIAKKVAYYPIEIYRYYDAPTSLTRDKNGYIARMVNDFGKTSVGFSKILLRLKKEEEPIHPQLWNNLTYRRDYYVFFYISLMIRAGYTKDRMNERLQVLKQKDAYPIKNFIGPEYNNVKWKFSNYLFNKKTLLLNLAPMYRKLYP